MKTQQVVLYNFFITIYGIKNMLYLEERTKRGSYFFNHAGYTYLYERRQIYDLSG